MSYSEKFNEAVKYRNELFPALGINVKTLEVEIYESYLNHGSITPNELNDVNEICLDFIAKLTFKWPGCLRLNCDGASDMLKRSLHKNGGCNENEAVVTIGDVFYRGKCIYNVNQEKIRRILEEGRVRNKDLHIHAWITYKSFYVFDPTIKLNMNMATERDEPENCLLQWDDNNKQEFDYYPLLVDNEFSGRVDELREDFRYALQSGYFSF